MHSRGDRERHARESAVFDGNTDHYSSEDEDEGEGEGEEEEGEEDSDGEESDGEPKKRRKVDKVSSDHKAILEKILERMKDLGDIHKCQRGIHQPVCLVVDGNCVPVRSSLAKKWARRIVSDSFRYPASKY